MRRVLLTASSLIVLGTLGWACDNDPTTLGAGPTGSGGNGGDNTTNTGGTTSSNNGGNGATGNEGGGGNMGTGGQGGAVEITTCVEDLAPQETPIADHVIISEISIGNYVEVYNPTATAINLGTTTQKWCVRPSYGNIASAGITVEPGGYRTIPWPNGATGTNSSGEYALYQDTTLFGTASLMVDYVCWGTTPIPTRKTEAENAASGPQWSPGLPCAAALTNGVIKRLPNNNGDAAASWDSTLMPDPTNCEP